MIFFNFLLGIKQYFISLDGLYVLGWKFRIFEWIIAVGENTTCIFSN